MSCLKHLPFLFSAAFLVLLLGLKAELESGNERRLLIGHYTLPPRKSDKLKQKEPTYGWTQSFFMKGFSISQLKNDHQSGWKQQGKPSPCQNLLSRIVSIPSHPKRAFYNYSLMFLPFEANDCFLFFPVPPSKPVIRLADGGQSVEGYLGPYQIGTRLALVCQVNGGKEAPFLLLSLLVQASDLLSSPHDNWLDHAKSSPKWGLAQQLTCCIILVKQRGAS